MKLKNDLLLRTARGQTVERPPVWLMRQAGRILPQYRALRKKVSNFKELVQQPELAAQVTLQPVDELGVDAAILFSDILVIPEAMGLNYELIEKHGPHFPKTIQTTADIEQLAHGTLAAERLDYIFEAIRLTKNELNGKVPLIGFSGAPWTLLAYMVEGSGSKTFSKAKKFLYTQPKAAHRLLEKITETVIAYLKGKIRAGVDAVQIFDSWAGILSPEQFADFSLPYISRICSEIEEVPVIVFPKGAWFALKLFRNLKCEVIGLDWNTEALQARTWVGKEKILQGNLDPCLLYANHFDIQNTVSQMLKDFNGKHIANLGHGVYPDTPLDNVKCFVDTVKAFRYS